MTSINFMQISTLLLSLLLSTAGFSSSQTRIPLIPIFGDYIPFQAGEMTLPVEIAIMDQDRQMRRCIGIFV